MRLIDADELLESIEETTWYHIFKGKLIQGANGETDIPLYKASDIYSALDAAPTVDAEPVRHGKWLKFTDNGTEYQTCSECNYDMQVGCGADSWCPACGALMDGGNDEKRI